VDECKALAIGQNAMREGDVIRVPWDEIRTNQRDAARIISRVVKAGGVACVQISVKYEGRYIPVFINFRLLFVFEGATKLGGDEAGGGRGGKGKDDSGDDGWQGHMRDAHHVIQPMPDPRLLK